MPRQYRRSPASSIPASPPAAEPQFLCVISGCRGPPGNRRTNSSPPRRPTRSLARSWCRNTLRQPGRSNGRQCHAQTIIFDPFEVTKSMNKILDRGSLTPRWVPTTARHPAGENRNGWANVSGIILRAIRVSRCRISRILPSNQMLLKGMVIRTQGIEQQRPLADRKPHPAGGRSCTTRAIW